jgi:hypothetical protein
MKLLKALSASTLILLSACSSGSVATYVAAFGIAGAALSTYCISGGSGCSTALVSYGVLVTTQATQDESILLSGSSTTAQLNTVLTNLNTAIQTGNSLPGLTTQQLAEVKAITQSATEILPLVEALVSAPASGGAVTASASRVVTFKLSSGDRKKLADMHAKIAALRR